MPDGSRAASDVDFVIADDDMQALRDLDEKDYGEHAVFPAYRGR